MKNPNALRPSEYVAIGLTVLAVAVQSLVLYRFVPTLAGMYAGYGLSMSAPLGFYVVWANRMPWIGCVLLAALIGFRLAGLTMAARVRATILTTLAIAAACSTVAGLYFTAEDATMMAIRLNVGTPVRVLERDLAALNIASGNAGAAIALIDPNGDRDDFVTPIRWNMPGLAFQLAEAYRAEGNVEAARRLYRRSQESAAAWDAQLTGQLLARYLSLEKQYGPEAVEWAPSSSTLRQFPDVVRAAAQQRLDQLDSK